MSTSPPQPLKRARYRSTAARWFASVVVGVLLGISARWLFPAQSEADHAWDPHIHLGSINSFEVSNFCVWIEDSSMSHSAALDRVRNTLLDNSGWEGVGGGTTKEGKVLFSGTSTPCFDLDPPDWANVEIDYYVQADTTMDPICGDPVDPPPPPGDSCAWLSGRYDDPDPLSGHREYAYGYVRFVTAHINGTLTGWARLSRSSKRGESETRRRWRR